MSNVTVEINGRETVSKAALEAKNGIAGVSAEAQKAQGAASGLSSETKKLDGMFGGFVITAGDVVNAVKAVAQAAWSTVEAFAGQEKSIAQFNAAMSLSGNISAEGAESLRLYAEEMGNLTGEDDEAILSMEAFLAASGRNESQIRKLISAAADYSAATGKDMRTSVEELNKTFSGTEGRLGMLIPALKDLTEEELKAGKGIDAVAAQYDGFAAKMSGIADVELKNFKNAYDDVLAAIGKEVWPAIQPALENVTKFMREKLIPGIGEFFDVTVAIFENFPEVAKKTFQLIYDIIRLTFSWETMYTVLVALGDNIVNAFSSAFSIIPDMFLDIIGLLFNPITQLGLYIADTLTKAFSGKGKEIASPGDFISGLFQLQFEAIGRIAENSGKLFRERFQSTVSMAGAIGEIFGPAFVNYYADVSKIIKPTLTKLGKEPDAPPASGGTAADDNNAAAYAFNPAAFESANISATFLDDVASTLTNIGTLDFRSLAAEEMDRSNFDAMGTANSLDFRSWAAEELDRSNFNALGTDGSKSLDFRSLAIDDMDASNFEALGTALAKSLNFAPNVSDADDASNLAYSPEKSLDFRSYAQEEMDTSNFNAMPDMTWLEKIGGALSPLIDGFMGLVAPLSSVQQILNPLQTIFGAMMEVLGPLINTVLQPIVGILKIVGMTLGKILAPVISALGPVISLVTTAFVWLYNNAIRPVANAFIWVGNAIYNAIVWAVNKIKSIWGGAQIAYKSMDSGYLEKIDESDVVSAGATSPAGAGGSYGSSATYQKPRDITMYFEINTAALVGDGGFTQFCQAVKREFSSMGVINMVEA